MKIRVLKYLTVSVYSLINETYKLIGRPIDDIGTLVNNCDQKVWDIYEKGLTTSINQVDSDMGKQLIMKYKPKNLAELSAWVAAIRPGFASLLKYFLNREEYSTGNVELDNILTDSYHYMMYQENIMSFLVWLGIEEKGTYDIIKKISKKKFKEEELNDLKKKLKENWISHVGSEDFFEENWQTVQDAAHYSFNACVSGDTKIQRAGYNNHVFVPTVEEMYLIKNDVEYAKSTGHMSLHQKYRSTGYGNALSMCDDNRIRKNAIVDIRYSGIRKIYRVTTASGATLDCTMNHKFPTINGKKRLEELHVGDYLFVKGQYEVNTSRYLFTNGVFESNVPKKGQMGFQKKPDGNSVRFNQKENLCRNEQRACEICGKKYDGSRFELHHMDLDRTNNSDENLRWLCNSCHKKEHYRQNRKKTFEKGIPTFLDQIISIEYLRTDKTYDIEMAAPYHTFVSENGLVTSNSHALSVAIDSLYGAYLKANYPLEYFTVALSFYSGDMEKTANLTKELPYFNIQLYPIRYGKSGSGYSMDREHNAIYKGVGSVKYCNDTISEELLELSKNNYDNFIQLLYDIKAKTSVNSRQLNILIGLNFFEQFGKNKYLQMVTKLYEDLGESKQIKKNDLQKLYDRWHITEDMVRASANKETPKLFKDINNRVLMEYVLPEIPNKSMSVVDQIKFEMDNLEMVIHTNPQADLTYYAVIGYKTYSDINKPYLTLYRLNDGVTVQTKIKRNDILPENPFRLYSILKITEFKDGYKMKQDKDGHWQKTDDMECILEKYKVVVL